MSEKLDMHVKPFLPRIGLIPMPKRLGMHAKPNCVFGGEFSVSLASFACQAWTHMPVIAFARIHIELAYILSLSFECNFLELAWNLHGISWNCHKADMEFHGLGMPLP